MLGTSSSSVIVNSSGTTLSKVISSFYVLSIILDIFSYIIDDFVLENFCDIFRSGSSMDSMVCLRFTPLFLDCKLLPYLTGFTFWTLPNYEEHLLLLPLLVIGNMKLSRSSNTFGLNSSNTFGLRMLF